MGGIALATVGLLIDQLRRDELDWRDGLEKRRLPEDVGLPGMGAR